MGSLAAGKVVLLKFPFSDLTGSKLRPALLLASVGRGDWIACQITSNPYGDPLAIALNDSAFQEGGLDRASYVRAGKLFTASETLFVSQRGSLTPTMLTTVRERLISLFLVSLAE